jgi:hypothetical protein
MSEARITHGDAKISSNWRESTANLWRKIERGLMAASDWLNPILIKETRQALKSWQFALTFVLLLVACWIVTIGGVAMIGPSVYYAAGGGELLRAYYFILAFPLLVVVPFGAFRSLAAEREDNTYDLLSITTLRPRQIIGGKLGSAVVQMAVYFSAITPCLAFTYLLRGVDVPTIVLLLAYTFFASLALAMIGLLLATLTRQRYHQVILSVALVALLLLIFTSSQDIAEELVRNGYIVIGQGEFWLLNLVFGTMYATTFALAFLAAAAMITFETENRSTPLRYAMLVQQAALIGMGFGVWLYADGPIVAATTTIAILAGMYWWGMGTMLTGERPEMSQRVRRRLPQSALGRVFLTWLQPGPWSGFMFASANLLSVVLMCGVVTLLGATNAGGVWLSFGDFAVLLVVGLSYVVAYLGIGCLVIAGLRRVTIVTMFSGVLIHVLLLMAGSGIPTSVQWMSLQLRNNPYSLMQVTNPIWTILYLLNYPGSQEAAVLVMAVPAAAICALLLNMPGIVRELRRVRVALPQRIAEDEAELHPSPDAGPQNPWEEEESGAGSQESGNPSRLS